MEELCLVDLPNDILLKIIDYIDSTLEYIELRLVCKKFASLKNQNQISLDIFNYCSARSMDIKTAIVKGYLKPVELFLQDEQLYQLDIYNLLMLAIQFDQLKIVNLLVIFIEFHTIDWFIYNIFEHIIYYHSDVEIFELFYTKATKVMQSEACDLAASNGRLDILKILDKKNNLKCTTYSLIHSSKNDHYDVVKWLLLIYKFKQTNIKKAIKFTKNNNIVNLLKNYLQ